MKVRTLQRFREKDDFSIIHEVGSEFECSEERGAYLQELGFVENVRPKKVEEQTERVEPKPEKKPKGKNKPDFD